MGKIIGIDLGTTNSCVSFIEGGEPVVIPNAEGSRTTPSIVAMTDSGERLVGQVAKRQAITNPEHTVTAVKRLVGRKFDDEAVQRVKDMVVYEIVESESNGDAWVQLRDQDKSPSEVSAMILARMKETAEDYLGEDVEEAAPVTRTHQQTLHRQQVKAIELPFAR